MARKDIEIRVRTKDDKASRNAKKIADELNRLGTGGSNASSGIKKSSEAFAKMSGDLAKLQGGISGLESLNNAIAKLDKAGEAISGLSNKLASTTKGFENVRAVTQDYARQSEQLRRQIAAEEAALASRNADLKAATALQKENNAAVREAERLQKALTGAPRSGGSGPGRPTKGVGRDSGAPISSARESFAAFLAPEIAAAQTSKSELQKNAAAIKASVDQSKQALDQLGAELKDVSAKEKEFSEETLRAGNAMLALRADIAKAQGKFTNLEEEVLQANKAMGTLIFTQADVAAAAARATEELQQQQRALAVFEKFAGKQLSGGRGTIADPTTDKRAAALREAREELEILRAEQSKLDAVLQSSSGNVTAQVDAYKRMTQAVKLAEEQIRKLEIAQRLSDTRGQKTGYGRWISEYEKATKTATVASDRFAAASRRAADSAGKVAPQIVRVVQAKQNLATNTEKATKATALFGNETRTTLSFMQRMRGEVIALAASYIGLFGAYQRVTEAANAYRAVERAQQNLGVAFGGDTAKVRQEMAFLNAEADRLGFTFQTLADGYGKISVGAQSAGFSIADTRKLFISIIEASRVSGQSIEQTTGILRAFDQILSKGKIQAEELRGQLGDRMTGAFKLFADALGVTTAELDAMMKAGDVLADRDTLVKVAERLTAVYSGQLPKALASVGFAMDNFGRSIEKINLLMAEGLVESIKEASTSLANFVDSAEGQATFRALGEAAGAVISILAQVPEYLDLITTAAQVLLTVKAAQWAGQFGGTILGVIGNMRKFGSAAGEVGSGLTNLTRSQTVFAQAFGAINGQLLAGQRRINGWNRSTMFARATAVTFTASLRLLSGVARATTFALSAMWTALGGPIGVALTIGTIYATWESDADRATAALSAHETVVGRVQEAYGKAQGKVEDWAKEVQSITKLDAEANLIKLQESYRKSLSAIEDQVFAVRDNLDRALSDPGNADPAVVKELEQVDQILRDLESGVVPIDDIKTALSDLADASQFESVQELVRDLNETVNASADGTASIYDLSKAMEAARNVLKLYSKDTKEAAEEALGLETVVEETGKTFDNTAALEAYNAALDDLKSKIPSLAEDMERLQKTTELNAAAWTALMAAWNSGDYRKIKEVAAIWLRGLADNGLANITDELGNAGGAGGATAALIKRFEGFASRPYDDGKRDSNGDRVGPAIYRGGYGSDTVTRADGSIERVTQDMVITLADAERDLARRIAEFQGVVVSQIGQDRFNSFDSNQQAVLTSIAYNYGELPDRILDAVRTGSALEISQAITSLGADNGGINAGRRLTESRVFYDGGDANFNTMVEAETERMKAAQEQADATKKRLADLDLELAKQDLINQGKEREATILEAINAAREENPSVTEEELARIREKTALLYDQQNAQNGIELSEERVNQLYELRAQLNEQMNMAKERGDASGAEQLRVEIEAVDLKLREAIQSAIGMWTAIGGPEADVAIAKLRTMDMSLTNVPKKLGAFGLSTDTWYGVFQTAVQGIVSAFESFAQAIATGENAFQAFGRAALQVLAQVLQQIAAAIIQMQILKMLQGFGGGIGAFATQMLGGMAGHTGGVVGSKAIGGGNRVGRPDWMRSALTYHTGGMAGFAPDEVSATLKKGEEILTEEDPRHRNNLGGGSSAEKGGRLTQVLAIGENQIREMLNQYGSDATLTHIKTNAPTIRRMLGV